MAPVGRFCRWGVGNWEIGPLSLGVSAKPAHKTEPVGIKGTFIEPSAPGRTGVQMEDGQIIDAGPIVPSDDARVGVSLVCEIDTRYFERCPICGDGHLTEEHVPPASVGGDVRTGTCAPCNHRLATLVEDDLAAWYDQRPISVAFEQEGVRGARKTGRVRVRKTPDGQFAIVVAAGDPAVREMLEAGGEITMIVTEARPARIEVALLKHAYLAACLHLGEVPQGSVADAVRAELIAVRDATDRNVLPATPLAGSLDYGRSYEPAGSSLHLALVASQGRAPVLAILLGSVWASWPLGDSATVDRALTLAAANRARHPSPPG